MWEKEAEVDRYRDRWPMSLLVSRVKMFNAAPENKPRDLVAALAQRRGQGGVSILAEVSLTSNRIATPWVSREVCCRFPFLMSWISESKVVSRRKFLLIDVPEIEAHTAWICLCLLGCPA